MAQRTSTLALFDFDGTLVRLATDWNRLQNGLERLAAEAGVEEEGGLLALLARLDTIPVARAKALQQVTSAELAGVRSGSCIAEGVDLYLRLRDDGARVAIVSHNSRQAIDEFFEQTGLPNPHAVFDRQSLGESKERSDAIVTYVNDQAAERVLVIGDTPTDHALAERLGAEFVLVGAESDGRK